MNRQKSHFISESAYDFDRNRGVIVNRQIGFCYESED